MLVPLGDEADNQPLHNDFNAMETGRWLETMSDVEGKGNNLE